MSDNVTARKKLESIEKARRAEEARKEKIKAQKLRGVDTSDGNIIRNDDFFLDVVTYSTSLK